MKIKLLTLTLISCLLFTAFLSSCTSPRTEYDTDSLADTEVMRDASSVLSEGEDMGQSYIDGFIFIGESTTYHMKNRAVLSGGKDTKQIWAPKSGTMMLDLGIDTVKIVYPETSEELTFSEAAALKKPEYVIMTFGLNGAVQNIKKGEEFYKRCYKKLISAIRDVSPSTKIIIQSAFPVAENMDMSAYSVSLETLNQYIDTLNDWSRSLAEEENCRYLDTSEILKDENGNLKLEYQTGDGHHLTAEAYRQILYYIRTHPYR